MRYALSLLAAMAAASIALAQANPPTPPTAAQMAAHQVQRYTALLALTAAQQEQATTIFTSEAASEAALHTTEHTERQALDAAIKAGNSETIQAVASQLGQLNGSMTAYRALAESALYLILTADQQAKFTALENQPGGLGGIGPGHPPLPR